ncbi:667_t:CDS:10 [Acaulospora morrowiae]|uniref:667_t:CDS:1 n=1 Tax=Acaulospora morrowiae TaxID=94023 RepID=A0A9N8YV36_9GLOM|nr:667_t:CDS:10 [Acaulospora morrowiae]
MSNNVDYDEEDAFLYGTLGNETTTAQGEEEGKQNSGLSPSTAFVVKQEICFVVSLLLLVLIVGFIISYAIVNPSSNKIKNEEIEENSNKELFSFGQYLTVLFDHFTYYLDRFDKNLCIGSLSSDDDLFDLYGDESNNEISKVNEDSGQIATDSVAISEDDNEIGQIYQEEIQSIDPMEPLEENEIIMDAVPPPKPTDTGTRNPLVNIKPNTFNKSIGPQRHEGGQTSSSRTPGVDINAIGTIDGTSIYDVDLDSVEDKPWRKPGADITDYFNYGFNEYTWKAYCAKQKQMREDQHSRKKIHVYESKQEINNLPPELQSISQSQTGLDHPRFQQQRGRGRRGRDQDDSVIQVVSSEREAALDELEPLPQPTIMDGPQNDEYGMESGGYPQEFQGPPMGMGMFPPPDIQMGPHPPFFMGNPEMPPSGPMGFDPAYRGGQGMRNMNNMGNMMRPTGMPGGMPGMTNRMPPTMPGGGMPSGGMPGMPRGMPGGMVGRGRGMAIEERPFFSMDDQSWEMENRNTQPYRPVFQGRPPTGPMHGAGVNRSDYNDWEHSPPPDAPFAHRLRPPFRSGAPPTGPADHRGLSASVDSPSSDRGDEERSGDNRSASGSAERTHSGAYDRDNRSYRSREDERWDGSRKRTTGEAPRDDDEFRAKRRH